MSGLRYVIALTLLLFCSVGAWASGAEKKILVISSYSSDYQWSNAIVDKVSFEVKRQYTKAEFNVEYLSSELFANAKVWVERVEMILGSYCENKPSLVMLVSDEAWMAYRAANRNGMADVPVVLCGVKPHSISLQDFISKRDDLSLSDFVPTTELMNDYNAAGVIRTMNVPKYVSLMEQSVPDISQYLLITDSRFYGVYTRLEFDNYMADLKSHRPVKYLDARYINTDSLLMSLPAIEANTGVLMTSWLTGEVGFDYSREFVYNEMGSILKAPIFITNNIGINSGNFIGGCFSDASFWGEKAARIAVKLLNGVSADKIPTENYVDDQCYVNWDVLTRFKLSSEAFPSETIFIHKPQTVFEKYKNGLAIAGVILILCVLMVVYVLSSNVKLKRARKLADMAVVDASRKNQDLVVMQESLRAALEKAEAADRLKSAFISSLDKEIRSPLNTIVGFSSLIVALEDKDEIEEAASQITENSEKLLELIKIILDLAQIESGTAEFFYEKVYLDAMLKDLVAVQASRITSNVTVKYVNPRGTVSVVTDLHRLSQVVSNVLDNAIKFTREGRVEVGYLEVDDNVVEIYVQDTGVGIKQADIEMIFDRFYKLDQYSSGSGLGLSISKKIIEILGGEIGVESKFGVGSRFWIRLKKDR